jgi:glyoxylase-like metal-dependent hydrolase (beta-lactamase superfamily II)
VHISAEEHARLATGHWRYLPVHFSHGPKWHQIAPDGREWFGLEARHVSLAANVELLLIPLFGHTLGHCGVAVRTHDRWLLHVGDAYYLRVELTTDDHPVSTLTAQRADDDSLRRASLAHLRRLATDHANEIELIGYHDFGEFPPGAISSISAA